MGKKEKGKKTSNFDKFVLSLGLYIVSFQWIYLITLLTFLVTISNGITGKLQVDLLIFFLIGIVSLFLIYLFSFRLKNPLSLFLISTLLQFSWLPFLDGHGNLVSQISYHSPLLIPVIFLYAVITGFGYYRLRILFFNKVSSKLDYLLILLPLLAIIEPYIISGNSYTQFIDTIKYMTNWKLNLWFIEGGWASALNLTALMSSLIIIVRSYSASQKNLN